MTAEHPILQTLAAPHKNVRWCDGHVLGGLLPEALESGATREAWKYTPITGFLDAFHIAMESKESNGTGGKSLPVLEGQDQPGIEATTFNATASEADLEIVREALSTTCPFPVALLSALLAADGWLIRVRQPLHQPLRLNHDPSAFGIVILDLAPGTNVELIEVHNADASDDATSAQLVQVNVQRDATLTHTRLALGRRGKQFAQTQVRLDDNARYRLRQYGVGAGQRRLEAVVLLNGQGAEFELDGASVTEAGTHLDQQFIVEHRGAGTRCRQRVHTITAERGKTVFNGRIHIHPGARASDAALSNRNLALAKSAEINTKPELEIYTDDVRCAHGATVGQLPEDGLYYLQSRGIPLALARMMLSQAFIAQCVDGPGRNAVLKRFADALA